MSQPQYLTGQKESIQEFLSKYDVRFYLRRLVLHGAIRQPTHNML